jgi:hypothetical protein
MIKRKMKSSSSKALPMDLIQEFAAELNGKEMDEDDIAKICTKIEKRVGGKIDRKSMPQLIKALSGASSLTSAVSNDEMPKMSRGQRMANKLKSRKEALEKGQESKKEDVKEEEEVPLAIPIDKVEVKEEAAARTPEAKKILSPSEKKSKITEFGKKFLAKSQEAELKEEEVKNLLAEFKSETGIDYCQSHFEILNSYSDTYRDLKKTDQEVRDFKIQNISALRVEFSSKVEKEEEKDEDEESKSLEDLKKEVFLNKGIPAEQADKIVRHIALFSRYSEIMKKGFPFCENCIGTPS